MKHKIIVFCLGVTLAFGLTACGNNEERRTGVQEQERVSQDEQTDSDASAESDSNSTQEQNIPSAEPTQDKTDNEKDEHVLIAYFSVPEDVDTSGVDAISSASIVVQGGEVYGNTEYVAKIVQETIGGDLFRIETTEDYPLDHDPLVDQAADEQDENLRPELQDHIEDLGQYDTVILGFPNWWADLPMPVYTFLEEYDFSGKTIIPFVTHGGSGFSGTEDTITELQPDAAVSDNTLSLSRGDVADSEEEIRQWAGSLGGTK